MSWLTPDDGDGIRGYVPGPQIPHPRFPPSRFRSQNSWYVHLDQTCITTSIVSLLVYHETIYLSFSGKSSDRVPD